MKKKVKEVSSTSSSNKITWARDEKAVQVQAFYYRQEECKECQEDGVTCPYGCDTLICMSAGATQN